MKRSGWMLAATAVLVVLVGAAVQGQEPSSEDELAGFDEGPASIDVSGYPAEMQAKYEIFALRCSKCHTLARPINSDYALEDEWSRYVKRMMRKPGSEIAPKDAKQIFEFLAYDSSVRKKELIARKKAEQGAG